jgi:Leucine-rich repeat (LRR) protein
LCKEIIFAPNTFPNETSLLKNLSITHTPLEWEGILPLLPKVHSIQNLDLSHNQISRLNPATFPADLKYLNLEGNTFDCNDCSTLHYLSNLTSQNETELSGQLFCRDFKQNSEQRYNIMSGYQHFCHLQVYPFILAFVILVFVVILIVIYTSRRVQIWLYNCSITSKLFLSEKDVGDKKYDLFISYAEEDSGISEN